MTYSPADALIVANDRTAVGTIADHLDLSVAAFADGSVILTHSYSGAMLRSMIHCSVDEAERFAFAIITAVDAVRAMADIEEDVA